MYNVPLDYNTISQNMLKMLGDLSNQALLVEMFYSDLLKDNTFNSDEAFISFTKHFEQGKFYLFTSQGYMECLVLTKCYSRNSICYWVNNLVNSASQHFVEALNSLDKFKTKDLMGYRRLQDQLTNFKMLFTRMSEDIKTYNLVCQPEGSRYYTYW